MSGSDKIVQTLKEGVEGETRQIMKNRARENSVENMFIGSKYASTVTKLENLQADVSRALSSKSAVERTSILERALKDSAFDDKTLLEETSGFIPNEST